MSARYNLGVTQASLHQASLEQQGAESEAAGPELQWGAYRGRGRQGENRNRIWPLYPSTEFSLRDRVPGDIGKNSFVALPGKGGLSGLMPSRLCVTTWIRRRGVLQQWFKEKGVINSWTVFWLVGGEVIRSQHRQPSDSNCSGSTCLWAGNS